MFKIKPFSNKAVMTYEKTKKNIVQIIVVSGYQKNKINAFVFPSGIAGKIAEATK